MENSKISNAPFLLFDSKIKCFLIAYSLIIRLTKKIGIQHSIGMKIENTINSNTISYIYELKIKTEPTLKSLIEEQTGINEQGW